MEELQAAQTRPRWPWWLLMVLVLLIAMAVSFWLGYRWMFAGQVTTVQLAPAEAQVLDEKLRLSPERYSEAGTSRELRLSERELNALLARDPYWAGRIAIHLDQDLASATLLLPLDDDFPLLGGKTLRIQAGMELRQIEGRPAMILRGVSLWGVPLPNAWLGELKHVDLFSLRDGSLAPLARGIEEVAIRRGELYLRLAE